MIGLFLKTPVYCEVYLRLFIIKMRKNYNSLYLDRAQREYLDGTKLVLLESKYPTIPESTILYRDRKAKASTPIKKPGPQPVLAP